MMPVPRVLFGEDEDGKKTEPYETVIIDVDEEYSGTVVEKMAIRKAELTDMRPSGGGKTRITFSAPRRGMIGYHGEILSDTRGTGNMHRLFERMIVGENAKPDDLEVIPMKAKQLTIFRASGGKDDAIRLTPPKKMTLEQ